MFVWRYYNIRFDLSKIPRIGGILLVAMLSIYYLIARMNIRAIWIDRVR
jgi:hypothetical protein